MRPFVVLLGIVMGSTVYGHRLAEERNPLLTACLLAVLLAATAATSFYGELRARSWRLAAHGALAVMLILSLWTYWPKK